MVEIEKKTITGRKGHTVFYSVSNVRAEGDALTFDPFRFYSPAGSLQDGEGFLYFDVPGDSVSIAREEIDYDVFIRVQEAGAEAVKVYAGFEPEHQDDGLEGDVIIHAFVPADPQDVKVKYKEIV